MKRGFYINGVFKENPKLLEANFVIMTLNPRQQPQTSNPKL